MTTVWGVAKISVALLFMPLLSNRSVVDQVHTVMHVLQQIRRSRPRSSA